MNDTKDIKRAVAQDAAGFAAWLFPSGKRKGSKWHVGDVAGNPGESLAIDLDGEFAGSYCDWATGEKGDCIALVMAARGLEFVSASQILHERYRLAATSPSFARSANTIVGILKFKTMPPHDPGEPKLPRDATPGTEADWRELGALRRVSHLAVATAAKLGTLYFGTVCRCRCWILTDPRRLCIEARRMDGQRFPAFGPLGTRKAHTVKGSVKNWPVGLAVNGFMPTDFHAVLAVEGGGDYLAALDFTLANDSDCLPIAFLGAGAGSGIHPDALQLLRGLRLRFYPHHDPNGAGDKAVSKWAEQLRAFGATVDAFSFAGLRKVDNSAVNDLNDCTTIRSGDVGELEDLLP